MFLLSSLLLTELQIPVRVFSAQTDHAKYLFPKSFNKEERDEFITCQEKVFEFLIENGYMESATFLTVYALKNYVSRAESEENKMFLDFGDKGTFKQILITLETVLPPMANYGLLYGLSNRIAKEMGFVFAEADMTLQDVKNYTQTVDVDYLDLTYPCFTDSYAKWRVEYSENISNLLVEFAFETRGKDYVIKLLSKHGTSLTEFEKEFVLLKNKWLSSIGSSTVLSENPVPVVYDYYGLSCPLRFKTSRATYYVFASYKEDRTTVFEATSLREDYCRTKEIIIFHENEMAKIDAVAKNPTFDYAELSIYLCGINLPMAGANAGAIFTFPATIYSRSICYLAHEYTHYLTVKPGLHDDWQLETIAGFFEIRTTYMIKYYADWLLLPQYTILRQVVERHLGREYQEDDAPFLFDIISVVNIINLNYDYFQQASMGNYLVENYGMATTVEILSHAASVEQKTGKHGSR